jgi:hypothetical protein
VYKIKGFTIGDRLRLREKFARKPQLYGWYTGEIYVLDPGVIPNAERDDFETTPEKNRLDFHVGKVLSGLEDDAERFQAQGVADDRVVKYSGRIVEIANKAATDLTQSYALYAELEQIITDLRRQKSKASANKRTEAEDIIKRAQRLQKELESQADAPTPKATKRKREARQAKDSTHDESRTEASHSARSAPPPTLQQVLADAGWSLEGDVLRLVGIIQSCLEEVLSSNPMIYASLIRDFEARLSSDDAR